MKLLLTTLGAALGTACFVIGADAPKPAPPPATPTPDQKEKPRILTLESPAIPGGTKESKPTLQLAPGNPTITTPAQSPHTTVPRENTGPTITVNDKNAPLAPGIYVASPYTGIVVIPAPMDSGIFKPEPPNASKMPTAAPELKLTPKPK